MRLAGATIAAALAISTHLPLAHAQSNWPEEPLIAGMGFETCATALTVGHSELGRAMIGQWAYGFASGLATAGGEGAAPELAGLDAGFKVFLRQYGRDSANELSRRVLRACEDAPNGHVVEASWESIVEIAELANVR